MRRTPTIHDLIVLTLPPRHRCPLNRLPASRLLLPRSGLERSDFVLWHETDMPTAMRDVWLAHIPLLMCELFSQWDVVRLPQMRVT